MIKFIILVSILLVQPIYTQQPQHHIPWPSLADSPWPVLRGDMQGTGRSEYIGPRTNHVKWIKDMPLGVLYGPVIGYNDALYMGERALSPDTVNYFYAVDKDANDLWTFETTTNYPNNGGPIVRVDSSVYFASRNYSLYAVDQAGDLIWNLENISGNFRPFTPMAKNGDIYVATLDAIVIVSPEGFVKISLSIPGISPALVFSVGGDTLFFTSGGPMTSGRPGAINAADLNGDIYWTYNFAGNNWGIPLVDNQNNVYVFGTDSIYQGNYFLYCIKPDGQLKWRYQCEGFFDNSAPAIDKNGNIILCTRKVINGQVKDCLISLDYQGNENWVTPFEGDFFDHYIDHGLVCDAEGKIYCGSSTGGYFYCYDNYGTLLWTYDLQDLEYDSCPAIGSDGTLYIGTHLSSSIQNQTMNLIAIKDTATSSVDTEDRVYEYDLNQNYPNPFNPATTIIFQIPQTGFVTLKIYDILGKEVATLVNEQKNQGRYSVNFDASRLASGVYIYQLRVNDYVSSKKMMLLK